MKFGVFTKLLEIIKIFNRLHAMFWALANSLLFCCCINRQQANEPAMFYGERLHRAELL